MTTTMDSFQSLTTLQLGGREIEMYRLDALSRAGFKGVETLPYSIRVLLENLMRCEDGNTVSRRDIEAVANWDPKSKAEIEIAFRPSRVLLQDFTGVPAVVDLAAMREAFAKMGGDPTRINPMQPVDLVIDHSVQVDVAGSPRAFEENVRQEFERNQERYEFLKWGQKAFRNMRVVPPGTGIVHQVNLEYLASVVFTHEQDGKTVAYPDSLVGTDSHTTMVNGLGVLAWGVGGIEAEAAMLGQPISMLLPEVVGFRLTGALREGATATDLVLAVTQILRKKGVVGKFVEFFGPGLKSISLADRATVANMAPEYGATMGFFPVDSETLNYLSFTGRDKKLVELVEHYYKTQGMFYSQEAPEPRFTEVMEFDMGQVVPAIAGPKRPQDLIPLSDSKRVWRRSLSATLGESVGGDAKAIERWRGDDQKTLPTVAEVGGASVLGKVAAEVNVTSALGNFPLRHGSIVIAAITSCTNTSNPAVMMAAGLLAQKAVSKGLKVKPWVKTSLAPGSQVVTEYLKDAGVLSSLEKLNFHVVGYGCTTCIGNSGPLDEAVSAAIKTNDLVVGSVLSGNRNFEGRVNPLTRVNYLASPPLVVAYAIAGTMDIDFVSDSLGEGSDGKPVFLKDIWPSQQEVAQTLRTQVKTSQFVERYQHVLEGPEAWRAVQAPTGDTFKWGEKSTYIRKPTFFDHVHSDTKRVLKNISGARALAVLGDSVTTDHISPAGSIAKDSPAAQYLKSKGVEPRDFNSYGARRGNHEVMVRGTFANIRLRNLLVAGTEGGVTVHLPDGERMSIYDASVKYQAEGTSLIILAGKEYGAGSSRDWAAKGPMLLGINAVIAESYERIHRSNLIGMGILPLEYLQGTTRETLGLTGTETYAIEGIAEGLTPGKRLRVKADSKTFEAVVRIDTPQEVEYYLHGGILQCVLRSLAPKN